MPLVQVLGYRQNKMRDFIVRCKNLIRRAFGMKEELDFRTKFKNAIRAAIANIPDMEIGTKDVSVLVFSEAGGYDGEIHVIVTFYEKDKRTFDVRKQLAEAITKTIDEYFPITLTECWGVPFNENNGFSHIRNKKCTY